MKNSAFQIAGRRIGPGEPPYVIAELSANHGQSYEEAERLVREAVAIGADAVKLQTYTPDTITLDSRSDPFMIKGTIWEGKNLHDLYGEAYMPWDWQPRLKALADELGIHLFSSPFDFSSVDFLEEMGVPAYKIASFELVDLPLIERVAATGKPMIMSTGMATAEEIGEAVDAARGAGCRELALLKCTSAYPSRPDDMNLATIPDLVRRFGVPVGLSDHTLGVEVPAAAVALGATIIEKHFTLSRDVPGPDSAFSLEPAEFSEMVRGVQNVAKAVGTVNYQVSEKEQATRVFRRSLFAVEDIAEGEELTETNVRSIRPGHGLEPKHYGEVIGRRARVEIPAGTPLSWEMMNK